MCDDINVSTFLGSGWFDRSSPWVLVFAFPASQPLSCLFFLQRKKNSRLRAAANGRRLASCALLRRTGRVRGWRHSGRHETAGSCRRHRRRRGPCPSAVRLATGRGTPAASSEPAPERRAQRPRRAPAGQGRGARLSAPRPGVGTSTRGRGGLDLWSDGCLAEDFCERSHPRPARRRCCAPHSPRGRRTRPR